MSRPSVVLHGVRQYGVVILGLAILVGATAVGFVVIPIIGDSANVNPNVVRWLPYGWAITLTVIGLRWWRGDR